MTFVIVTYRSDAPLTAVNIRIWKKIHSHWVGQKKYYIYTNLLYAYQFSTVLLSDLVNWVTL